MTLEQVDEILNKYGGAYDRINISGGEPLAHPEFYKIRQMCREYLKAGGFIVVYVLKMVKQGREAKKPEVHFSGNWTEAGCKNCSHPVLRPDGRTSETPCRKDKDT